MSGRRKAVAAVKAADVAGWFEDAGLNKRLTIPGPVECERVAGEINRIMSISANAAAPKAGEKPGPALKYARLLVQHLPAEADRLEKLAICLIEAADRQSRFAGQQLRLSAGLLRGGIDEISDLLDVMRQTDVRKPGLIAWRVKASMIATSARHAWLDANGQYPKSPNVGDPINSFVQLALAHFEGFDRPPETIADALKPPRKSVRSVPKRPSSKRAPDSP